MVENKPNSEEHQDDFASADREFQQLVHLISTRFNGDTLAFFNSISPKPRVSDDSVTEYELVRNFLAKTS